MHAHNLECTWAHTFQTHFICIHFVWLLMAQRQQKQREKKQLFYILSQLECINIEMLEKEQNKTKYKINRQTIIVWYCCGNNRAHRITQLVELLPSAALPHTLETFILYHRQHHLFRAFFISIDSIFAFQFNFRRKENPCSVSVCGFIFGIVCAQFECRSSAHERAFYWIDKR